MELRPIHPVSRPRRADLLARAGLALWAIACVVVGAYMLAAHLLTLPAPAPGDPGFRAAIASQRRPSQHGWLVLHVLYQDCKCSRRVLDHLLATPRPADVDERVVLITDDGKLDPEVVAAVQAAGLDLDVAAPAAVVARYHVEVAPLLVVIDPGDTVRYVGGYTTRKQGADDRAEAVIAATRRGEVVDPLPVFGCAVSAALKQKLDPLGVR
ncbi:MAG: hypothetical protein K8W52_00940 [Deltaproteobacteria bacterium]|nr:hypothetical protein [Deltaproteobacteria bacterium]